MSSYLGNPLLANSSSLASTTIAYQFALVYDIVPATKFFIAANNASQFRHAATLSHLVTFIQDARLSLNHQTT